MEEIWKVYKTSKYHGIIRVYEISNEGNAKINGILVDFSKRKTNSYYTIGHEYVHKIVAKLFVPNPNNYPCVDHINGDRYDNRAVNLRWCTYKMNSNYQLAREHMSEAQKIAQNRPEVKKLISEKVIDAYKRIEIKQKQSEGMKGNKNCLNHVWMNNGIDRKRPHKDKVDYYLKLGYTFGWKI